MRSLHIALTVVLLFSLSLFSCGRRSSLDSIDNIMETRPDSALAMLSRIDRGSLSEDELPFYALLTIQAQFKCKIPVTSDSLFAFAYEKYRRHRSGDLKKRTMFYHGKIYYYKKDYPVAMKSAVEAYEIAKKEDDDYWIAKTVELMSDIYSRVDNEDEAERCSCEAIKYYLKAGRIANHRFALCDLAASYVNRNRFDEAKVLLDSLRDIVIRELPKDTLLIRYIDKGLSHIHLANGEYDGIKVQNVKAGDERYIENTILRSYLLDNEDAFNILSEARFTTDDEREHLLILYALYCNDMRVGNYDRAAHVADTLLYMQSAVVHEMLKETVMGAQKDFYSARAYDEEQRSRSLYFILISVSVFALVIILLIVRIYHLGLRARKAELETNIGELRKMKQEASKVISDNRQLAAELERKDRTLTTLRRELDNTKLNELEHASIVEGLFRDKWDTLNMLCDEYFEMGESEKTRTAILNNIKKEIDRLRSPKNLKNIEDAVNHYLGGIMTMLREECPFLKEEDFRFLSLVYAGFSVRAVCLFTGIKYKLFYLKKSRLIKRILDSSAPHRELFREKIG